MVFFCCRLHDQCRRRRNGYDHIHLIRDQIGRDLVQSRGIRLAVLGILGIVEGDAQLRALGVEFCLNGLLDLIERGVVNEFHNADLVDSAFGSRFRRRRGSAVRRGHRCLRGRTAGRHGKYQRNRRQKHQRTFHQILVFHGKFLLI